ncbi:hypothetical protein T07_2936 [Trichinella nelsoni]|uniref:Uncharacterized protein n=1 Tax=Trichinella nelsoni TaxID=6336 RepID=A0A0V0SIP9_9BILA|nr:hypothetical protein T07_2936 [Trichinella nelsoni]
MLTRWQRWKNKTTVHQNTESAQRIGTAKWLFGAHRHFDAKEGSPGSYLEMNFMCDLNFTRSCLLALLAPEDFEELRRITTTLCDFTNDECMEKMKQLYGRWVILMRERAQFFHIT